jgi:hypothetical protein
MAASIAFEQPSIQKAWDAFLKHIPVLLVIWVGSIALAVVGLAVSMLIVMAVGSVFPWRNLGSTHSDSLFRSIQPFECADGGDPCGVLRTW